MSISVKEAHAVRVSFNDNNLSVELADGRQISVPLSYFPRLLKASSEQRNKYVISGGGTGLHWEEIDEDISVNGLLVGIGDRTV
jgi:hypothetical protein